MEHLATSTSLPVMLSIPDDHLQYGDIRNGLGWPFATRPFLFEMTTEIAIPGLREMRSQCGDIEGAVEPMWKQVCESNPLPNNY